MSGFLGLTGGFGAIGSTGVLGATGTLGALSSLLGPKFSLQLGSVLFNRSALEVPEEIGNLGGHQVIAQHDFPGGARTQQVFGAFPDEIMWQGWLTGGTASDRLAQIDAMRVAGQVVTLSYGPKSWPGRIISLEARAQNQNRFRYRIHFLPLSDTASAAAASGMTPEATLGVQTNLLTQLQNNLPFPLPSAITAPVNTVLNTIQDGLGAADGIVANIGLPSLSLIAGAVTTVTAALPLIQGGGSRSDAFMATAAANASTSALTTIQKPLAPQRTVTVLNPNLPQLAAQYLGDATQWQRIAIANNIVPPDPMPLGQFTLSIPPLSAQAG